LEELVTNDPDPVRARRARIARFVTIGQRAGYGAIVVAIGSFAAASATDFPGWLVTLTVVALVIVILVLPAPIVLGYGVKIAEREEREAQARAGQDSGPAPT
jgi:hypothetical protein